MNRTENKALFLLFICLSFFIFPLSSRADDDSDIVEKNLFSPEREKWSMAPADEKKTALEGKKGKVDDITLSGTVVSDKVKTAVLAVRTKRKPGESSLYMEGDYMSGYLLKEIKERSVILEDVQSGEDYTVFLNDGKKSRSAVKTEIREEKKDISADKDLKKAKKPRKRTKQIVTTPAETDSILKDRLQQSLEILGRKDSKLVLKQAENDLKKLKKLVPHMSGTERKEIRNMTKKLDELKKKNKKK